LISDDDLISELLEDVHCGKSSYEVLQCASASTIAYRACADVIGLFVFSGSIEIELGGNRLERLKVGHFMLLLPHQPHRLRIVHSEAAKIGRVTHSFDMGRARLLFKILPPVLILRDLEQHNVDWQFSLSSLIAEQSDATAPAAAAINRRLVEVAFIFVVQQFLLRNADLRRHMANSLLARISPALQAIHHNPDKPWTIAALARLSAMSRTLFAVTFVKSTGESPGRYLVRLRMERARDLLHHSHLPLAMVAQRAGYGTDAAFSRAFKRQFGITPGQCRAERDCAENRVGDRLARRNN
jgi:AraC-like DNA-binding protein